MPSTKPRFTVRTEQDILDKISYIAAENERSATQEIVYLMKQRIRDYEKQHGSIVITQNGDNNTVNIGR